jgi:hypothetical protein
MQPGFEDITSLINQEPQWYMPDGYPRYCEFDAKEVNIYARYGVLYEIGCQGCPTTFKVGQAYDKMSNMLLVRLDHNRLDPDSLMYREDPTEIWVPLRIGVYCPRYKDEEGNNQYRTLTIEECIRQFSYGDAPGHRYDFGQGPEWCAGTTMGTFPIKTLVVLDHNFGQETGKNKFGHDVITKWGETQRLTELEGLDLMPDWMLPVENVVATPVEDIIDW